MLSHLPLLPLLSSILTTTTTITGSPSITFQNRSPSPICYKVELTTGTIPTNAICDFAPGIRINSTAHHNHTTNSTTYGNITLYPTADFNGAITAMTMNGTKGARHEINFNSGGPTSTWYDIDYELGMSNSTLGPRDHRNLTNGLPSLAGEKDCVTKANDAWVLLRDEEKVPLLPHHYYLDHRTASGNLSMVRVDKKVPFVVKEFLQVKANFSGYVGSGSVAGVVVDPDSREGRVMRVADVWSFAVGTQQMAITAY